MSELLTKAQVAELQEELLRQRDEMRQILLSEYTEISEPGGHDVYHGGEEYFDKLLKDIGGGISDLHVKVLRDINAALQRISSGQYGVCIDCGDAIGFGRLQAFPVAKRCFDCKLVYEKRSSS